MEAVSDRVSGDVDGSVAFELSRYLANESSAPGVPVPVDDGPVPVEDGWWMLVAEGRRPLLAWVEGSTVSLGDKADVPGLTKEVWDNVSGVWGESGTYGSGQTLDYRLTLTVPVSMQAYGTYWVEFHDSWDARLSLDEGSVRLQLVKTSGETFDLTEDAHLSLGASSLTVRLDELSAVSAEPGDALVLTYTMAADALLSPGSGGLVNEAWATYPSWDGDGETPHDRTRVYAFSASIAKSSPGGEPLEGATFAVRDTSGEWLCADGTFADEGERATFVTDEDGLVSNIPLLAPGSYVLVELSAPEGYLLPDQPETSFTLSASHSFDRLALTVEASGAAEVSKVDATGGSFVLSVVNQPDTPSAPPLGNLPRTWDSLPPWGKAAVLLCAAALALAAGALARRRAADETPLQP